MDAVVSVFTNIPSAKTRHDDDFVDRLSSRYSVIVLVVFAIVVSMHQYVGTPITCWVPVHFTDSHTKFTNSYCWVRNTYYLPFEEEIPKEHEEKQMIPYYQWVPFILLGQAVLFYFPSIIWHGLNSQAGVDADNILGAAQTFNKTDKVDDREKTLTVIRNQMNRFLKSRKGINNQVEMRQAVLKRDACGRRFGGYLIVLYIITKIFYLANVIAQLFILNHLLATEFTIYGIDAIKWMITGEDWHSSPGVAFPRVTMCDFKIRRLGNVHRYTVQCTLPINLYTEKIYMFLWFWMVFVAVITALSLLTWIGRAVSARDHKTYVKNHLRIGDRLHNQGDEDNVPTFVTDYLRVDGVFLLRLIGHNTNSITVTDIVSKLWDRWPDLQQKDPVTPVGMSPSAPDPEMQPLHHPGFDMPDGMDGPDSDTLKKPPLPP